MPPGGPFETLLQTFISILNKSPNFRQSIQWPQGTFGWCYWMRPITRNKNMYGKGLGIGTVSEIFGRL